MLKAMEIKMLKKIYQAIVLASPWLKMPHPLLPVVLMLPEMEGALSSIEAIN